MRNVLLLGSFIAASALCWLACSSDSTPAASAGPAKQCSRQEGKGCSCSSRTPANDVVCADDIAPSAICCQSADRVGCMCKPVSCRNDPGICTCEFAGNDTNTATCPKPTNGVCCVVDNGAKCSCFEDAGACPSGGMPVDACQPSLVTFACASNKLVKNCNE